MENFLADPIFKGKACNNGGALPGDALDKNSCCAKGAGPINNLIGVFDSREVWH